MSRDGARQEGLTSMTSEDLAAGDLGTHRLEFLSRLSLLLTSSLDVRHVIKVVLRHLSSELNVQAMSVFLREGRADQLTFWSLEGNETLQGKMIDASVGIVGWVATNQLPALVNNVNDDPRFYRAIDSESGFQTRSVLCVPLFTRGNAILGAIEALNALHPAGFSARDLAFLEQVAAQVSLAIENAQLFQETRTRAHQLAVLDRRKQEMLTVITHELRTPLNVIRNAAELVLDPAIPMEARSQLGETLERGVARLSALVARLKTVSAVTEERFPVQLGRFDVLPLLRDIVAQFDGIEPPRELSFSLRADGELPPAFADPGLVTVAMRNLIANAIRFTPDGGSISVGAVSHAGLIELWVGDTGIGIEPAEIPLIFEKFYEVSSAEQHSSGNYGFRSGGLGLGLAAVKSIVEAHGGTVKVESTPHQGSRFSFCIRSATSPESTAGSQGSTAGSPETKDRAPETGSNG